MIARPVAVEPVNDTMSTRGSVASTEATSLDRGVTTLRTPGGMSVSSATSRPSSQASHGVSGRRLEDDRAPGGQRGPDLGEVDLGRHVPRRDRGDDADRLAVDRAPAGDAHRRGDPEVGLPLVGLRQVGDPPQPSTGASKPAAPIMKSGIPTSARGQRLEVVGRGEQRLVQLAQAAHPQLEVRRPVGLVERPPGGGDRGVDVGGGGVGRLADLGAGGRVEDRVGRPVARGVSLPSTRSCAGAVSGHPGSWVTNSPASTGGGQTVDGRSSGR